jgi:hypothetical protein
VATATLTAPTAFAADTSRGVSPTTTIVDRSIAVPCIVSARAIAASVSSARSAESVPYPPNAK